MKEESSEWRLGGWRITEQARFSAEQPNSDGPPTNKEFFVGLARNKHGAWAITFRDAEKPPVIICVGRTKAIQLCYDAICILRRKEPKVRLRIYEVLKNAASLSGNYTDGDGNLRDLAAAIYEATR